MVWTERLRDFEYSFLELQKLLEKRELSNLEQDNLMNLLKTTVERGWDTLTTFSRDPESSAFMRPYSLRDAVERQNFPLKMNEDLDLQFEKKSFDDMEWEIREIVYPAFRDLYLYLKTAQNQLQRS